MNKYIFTIGVLLCLPLLAAAQDYPRTEVLTGYSYLGGDVGTSFNGWNSSIAVNSNRNFGLVGDFSGHYTRYTQLHTILGGPRFTFRGNERVHPFVHALVGGGVLTEDGSWDSAFAWAVGAGADVKVSKNVAIRVIEVNYLQYRANDVVSHNGRIATGGVWRFGSNN